MMSKKFIKVANILEEGKLGGPQIRVMRVAKAIKGYAETIVIIPEENSERYRSLLNSNGIKYRTFPLTRITKEMNVLLRYMIFSVYEIFLLYKYFKKNNISLVHVSGGSWQYKGVIAGKLAKKKVIWHLNDTYMPKSLKLLFGFFSKYVDAFIFASERSKIYYQSFINTNKPKFIIPAPVDMSKFSPDITVDDIADLDFSLKGKFVIGTVSNVNPIKGLDIFIRAAAEINKHVDNVEFLIVGAVYKNQYKYFMKLKKLIRELKIENINFVGGQDDVRPWLKSLDIYLCASNAESSPISIWEAMSMRKTIISTDVGDVPKYIKSGDSGEIVPIGDYVSMADKVVCLLEDSEKSKAFAERAYVIAKNNFSVSACVKRHMKAYLAVVDME